MVFSEESVSSDGTISLENATSSTGTDKLLGITDTTLGALNLSLPDKTQPGVVIVTLSSAALVNSVMIIDDIGSTNIETVTVTLVKPDTTT